MERIPVVALTGHLGAGKTTLLNHVLRQPGARVGVVVNDFGDINVDAALVTGQVDEPASIAGGCLCCLVDDDTLDQALEKLTQPRLGMDVVIVEASGVAEPGALAKLIRFSGAARVRPGGVVDVLDAVEYFHTVDTGSEVPARFAAASLVVVNKCDRLPEAGRDRTLARIEQRVRQGNPSVHIVRTSGGRIDPALLFDIARAEDPPGQPPFAAARRETGPHHGHQHAAAATVRSPGPVEPGLLIDLLEDPPRGAYRIKGRLTVQSSRGMRGYVVNLVGRSIQHCQCRDGERGQRTGRRRTAPGRRRSTPPPGARARTGRDRESAGYRRLQQHRRLSQ